MNVTVFIEEEKKSLVEDPDTWTKKIEELGLTGQQELVGEDKRPIPFRRITDLENRVFGVLFPRSEPIEKFSAEPIPMKALSAYGLAKYEDMFEKVEIHYRPGYPDPIMVGVKNRESFLMAHWGETTFDIEELTKKAKALWISLHTQEAKTTADLYYNIEALADRFFAGQWVYFA